MGLKTTCIGAYPKPDYNPLSNWFDADTAPTQGEAITRRHGDELAGMDDAGAALIRRATKEAVVDQVECGIDIPTDGEQRRENYIHYHCRHLSGFDFERLTARSMRDGEYATEVPTVTGPVATLDSSVLVSDFAEAQSVTDSPIKITLPGPLSIIGTTADAHYGDDRALAFDLAVALNEDIRALADAGCTNVQVDEPVFAREPARALDFGIEALEQCFAAVPRKVVRTMHMCCGYPMHLDDENYQKADPRAYFELAEALDASTIDQVSIEDAHRHNDLSLFELFTSTTVILGAIDVAQSGIESVEAISHRLKLVLEHIDRERLMVAPDCGLGFLDRRLARAKLTNMTIAAVQA